MKRMDMVVLLQMSFIKHMNDQDIVDDQQMYSMVLMDLEDAGIRPPLWDNFNPTQSERTFSCDSDWNYHSKEKGYSLECGYWEEE